MYTRLNNQLVHLGHAIQGLSIHTGHYLLDCGQPMHLVAWIDTLGAISDLPVNTAFQTRLFLNDRDTDIFGHAGVDGGFVNNNTPWHNVPTDYTAGILHRLKIRSLVVLDRRRNSNNQELAFRQPLLIRSKVYGRSLNCLIPNLMGGVNTVLVLRYPLLVVVKANHLDMLGKLHSNRHADISKTNQSEFFFPLHDPFIQCFVVHFSLFPFISKRCKG